MATYKCLASGNLVTFTNQVDIDSMKGHDGYVPFTPGDAMLLDVGNTHAYINKSNEDRYSVAFNLYIKGKFGKEEYQLEIK